MLVAHQTIAPALALISQRSCTIASSPLPIPLSSNITQGIIFVVIPTKVGTQGNLAAVPQVFWIPTFVGMTPKRLHRKLQPFSHDLFRWHDGE
ncbi:hypothetical protein C7S18_19125 [Ahniella affigens]|uniref:Uncharacterized protein n=1 Tax=Ahniella affigens TaxID=2021234 RepID=A0A2P1PWD4_9GAMM|nr:hypothetical protein [Ahniella affigens]AVP99150.1 hypothetical protein C7S18_19125 [Ahniella affigens]